MKTYLIIGVLAALGVLGAFMYVSNLKSEIKEANSTINTLNGNISVLTLANSSLEKTNRELTLDLKASEDAREVLAQKKAEIKIVEKDRIVTIEKIVREDPELNNRTLSPVLAATFASIQAARSKK
jgi:hypothetical protein